jgi:hypothetical protein
MEASLWSNEYEWKLEEFERKIRKKNLEKLFLIGQVKFMIAFVIIYLAN